MVIPCSFSGIDTPDGGGELEQRHDGDDENRRSEKLHLCDLLSV
jgi:hypothetical protein